MCQEQDIREAMMQMFYQTALVRSLVMSKCWQLKEAWVCKQNHRGHSFLAKLQTGSTCANIMGQCPFRKVISIVQKEVYLSSEKMPLANS